MGMCAALVAPWQPFAMFTQQEDVTTVDGDSTFSTNQTVGLFALQTEAIFLNVSQRWLENDPAASSCMFQHWEFLIKDLTSSRNRGLSGMKMSPTSAARAGNRHTNMNNLQLCIWNSEPMAKPQPEKSDRTQSVRLNPFKRHTAKFKSLYVRPFSFSYDFIFLFMRLEQLCVPYNL